MQERYPLSEWLVDPSHSLIWLAQLQPRELRSMRLVCVVIHAISCSYFANLVTW
jgi:hypothetical protein